MVRVVAMNSARSLKSGVVFESDHRASSVMVAHRHGSFFVTIVLEGAYVEVRDSVAEVCKRGTLMIHDAAEEHADRFATDTRCLNVELAHAMGTAAPRGNIALVNPTLRDAVKGVVSSFYGGSPDLSSAVEGLQQALCARSLQHRDAPPPWLGRVIDAFPWADPVPLREASALAGLHETHFSRAFRRHVGMTANEYRMRARLRIASQLLLSSTDSLARVALGAGFSDQSHLTRVFTKQIGLAPAEYRRTFAR
ncbi:MAG TPA: helix-turn-helix transcriptional regulator [Candidatus Cybelea sp.]|nr:helix-turn-helix transcriptional regulator [Candidatus Cybelea sp.]